MKEMLVTLIKRTLDCLDMLDTVNEKQTMMDQCFGAALFACDLLVAKDEREQAYEIERLWNEVYKPRFEEKIYG